MTFKYRDVSSNGPWFRTPQQSCSHSANVYNAAAADSIEPIYPGAYGVVVGQYNCYMMAPQGGYYTFSPIEESVAPPGFWGGGGGSDGGSDGGDGSAPPSSYGGGMGGAGAGGGLGIGIDGASGESFGAGAGGGDVLHGANYYPDTLPCPKRIVTTAGERRLLSDITGRRQVRGMARDYGARESIEWPTFTQDQSLIFKLWWRETLNRGGSWFATSHWPSPQGGTVHRRFIGEPKWQYIHGGTNNRMWSVSAECEVSGRRI